MKRAFFLISLTACLMSCASTSGFDDPDVIMRECRDGAELYYCPTTMRCGHGICLEDTVDHCGDALIACKGNAICEEGLCVCESFSLLGNRTKEICSATCCPNGCVDAQSDPNNCGECGHACDPGQICVAGQCGGECPSYMKFCPSTNRCVDIKTDPNNCGGCGVVCPHGEALLHYQLSQCDNGKCVPICDSSWNDADNNILNGCEASPNGICGNGIIEEPGEICDGLKLNDQTCATRVGEGSKGTLRCSPDCQSYVTTGCSAPTLCGNGRIDSAEICDGTQLAGATCESLVGKGSTGVVKCNAQCNGYDLSACTKPETCGNGFRESHEACDGQLSAAITCEKIVGKGSIGNIQCAANCASYDISGCTAAAECGNLRREAGEACDGGDFGNATCATTVGAGSMGTLICSPQCEIDSSRCSKPSTCGDNRVNGNDVCDGSDLQGKSCATVVGAGSTGKLKCRDNCSGYDISECTKPSTCDGHQIDPGEVCDGTHLNDKTCASLVGAGSTGTLKCKNCSGYDTSSCTPPSACGNGKIDSGETCDGANINNNTCAKLVGNGSVGTPRCSKDCRSFDLSGCSAPNHCGNGVLDTTLGEVCDGSNLNGKSCATEVGQGSTGSLKCSNDCFYFDMSGCKSPARCGDGIIQNDEKCDMTNLAKRTCESELGAGAIGTLRCNATCNGFDTSGCIVNTCGNGALEKTETCDGTLLNGWTCDKQVGAGSTGTPKCNATCSGYENGSCTPAATCGDGKLNPGEDCDKTSFRNNITNCKTYNSTLYASGKLTCSNTCTIDTSGCVKAATAKCGNNTIEAGEICDGSNFGGKTCTSELGTQSASGILQCTNDCKTIDTSYCEFCGDKKLQANEECDGSSWRYNSCVAYNAQLYSGGTLSCNNATCKLNTSACTLKNVNVECKGDEVRCTATSPAHLQACVDGVWENMEDCTEKYPICSESNIACIPSQWCNVQKIGIENGKWVGYSRILLPASVPEPELYLTCTQNLNLPLEYWANNFMILTEKNTQCHDCGNNIEFMTSEDFDFYSGTWYCTFIAQFEINNVTKEFACLPIQNGPSEPIQVTNSTMMTPQTTWIVNN